MKSHRSDPPFTRSAIAPVAAVAPVESDDVSRFEGEGGPEAPVLPLELVVVPLKAHPAETVQGVAASKSKINDSMKINIELTENNSEGAVTHAAEPTPRTAISEAHTEADIPKGFRRLKRDELVSHGDFMADKQRGLEPWVGPSGFRADSFVKPIYRQDESQSKKSK